MTSLTFTGIYKDITKIAATDEQQRLVSYSRRCFAS